MIENEATGDELFSHLLFQRIGFPVIVPATKKTLLSLPEHSSSNIAGIVVGNGSPRTCSNIDVDDDNQQSSLDKTHFCRSIVLFTLSID